VRLDCANYPVTAIRKWTRAGCFGFWHSQDLGLNTSAFIRVARRSAFEAADELGMYFQVELPNKRSAFKAPESAEAAKRNIDYLDVPGADPNASLYDYALREAN